MLLKIARKSYPVASFAEASAVYAGLRNESGLGGSRWPEGIIIDGGEVVARVSYNARVWEPVEWTPDAVPLYCARAAADAARIAKGA